MRTKAPGNLLVLSGILVAAALAAVTYFVWEFYNTPEPENRPKIVYGVSESAFASSPTALEGPVEMPGAVPLDKTQASDAAQSPASAAGVPASPDTLPVPSAIASSTEKGRWIYIDKRAFRLYLAEGQTVVNSWGVAVGKVPGDKQKSGDMRTPEGSFPVQQIQSARTWTHDFKDGKGVIAGAYGPWFIRLKTTPWTGIGIHGTHDPASIGTCVTEGCVRMKNEDLEVLKPNVAIGMTVVIGPNGDDANKSSSAVKADPGKQTAASTPQKPAERSAGKTSGKRFPGKRNRKK